MRKPATFKVAIVVDLPNKRVVYGGDIKPKTLKGLLKHIASDTGFKLKDLAVYTGTLKLFTEAK